MKTDHALDVSSRGFRRSGDRVGVASMILVVLLIVIIAVAGVGVYFALSSSSTPSPTNTHSSSQTATHTSSSSATGMTSSQVTTSSTTTATGVTHYSGVFNFSDPVGPFGERTFSNNDTVQIYSTVLTGSGNFTYDLNAANQSGSGSGYGVAVANTTGFCSGSTTVHYTFEIPDATTVLGSTTVFLGSPVPGNITVALTCKGPMNGISTATNDPFPYTAAYTTEFTFPSVPAMANMHLSGGISYYFKIVQTD